MFEELVRAWDGELVAVRFDESAGAWILVGVHSTALGPGFGGTRMKVYPSPEDALRDVLRLSSAMTSKNAMADLPFGGGKSVLAVPAMPSGDARDELLRRYAGFVASLGGSYVTACDMNTTEHDMAVVAASCPFVMGAPVEAGGSGSSAPDTAVGVYHGIRASLERAFGSDDPAGRTIAIQGVGAVGGPLAERLADVGAKLVVADVDEGRARATAERLGADVAPAEAILEASCDVLAPCATGGVLNVGTIPRLRCRAVAGAANNQLATPEDADRLAAGGILYAPDYVVNAGGVLHLAGYERLGWSAAEMAERLAGIGETLRRVFDAADREGVTPEAAAAAMARERIAAARLGRTTTGPDA